ncbi:hypothetical protein ACFQH5_20205 [Halomonas salifodinae]|uniref:Uncharacterized protein n=1 Tax=Halomonas salifodinae TaxID=438745 RepID=A0ABW2F5P1_9GAMM
MTYLELVQRLRQETNYANTGPTSVAGQSGDHARAVSWVADAYTEIQNRHPWRWLRKEFTLTTSASVDTYDFTSALDGGVAISRFKSWHFGDIYNPPKSYLESAGVGSESRMLFVPWAYFRSIYRIGSQPTGAPRFITIDPNDNIVVGPKPDAAYVITGEYNRSAQVLSDNDDVPEMPSDYHMLIVYQAMEDFGLYDAATEILSRSRTKGRRLMRQLEGTQMPKMRMTGPMA